MMSLYKKAMRDHRFFGFCLLHDNKVWDKQHRFDHEKNHPYSISSGIYRLSTNF